MKKVLVIGSPGAGKTTFSKKLAAKVDLPLHHLDYYYHDNHFNYKNDTVAWRKKVTDLVNQPEWILDGNYKSTFDIRFPMADTIIFLDYPRRVALGRALLRRIKLQGKVRGDMPANWNEKFELSLLRFIWSYNGVERPKLYQLLQKGQPGQQIIIVKSSAQADSYLD
ncbi:MAG TPA: hypothetical protein VHT70_04070 [Candidatus Saccharimonadales bacterium]|jgi:adenylate kinase family enzyme|nr:hypothetical protein [Candidatus Saccharimonadales bacterium]